MLWSAALCRRMAVVRPTWLTYKPTLRNLQLCGPQATMLDMHARRNRSAAGLAVSSVCIAIAAQQMRFQAHPMTSRKAMVAAGILMCALITGGTAPAAGSFSTPPWATGGQSVPPGVLKIHSSVQCATIAHHMLP